MTEQEFDNLEWWDMKAYLIYPFDVRVDICKTLPMLYRITTLEKIDGEIIPMVAKVIYLFNKKRYYSKQKLLEVIGEVDTELGAEEGKMYMVTDFSKDDN